MKSHLLIQSKRFNSSFFREESKGALKEIIGLRLNTLLLMLGLFVLPTLGFSQTVLYSTNFGTSGTTLPTGWAASGSAAANIQVSSTSVSSTYTTPISFSAGNNLSDGATSPITGTAVATLSGQVNTVGYTSIQLSFGYRISSASYTATTTLDWSADGTTWNSIALGTLSTSGSWAAINGGSWITLPAGAQGQSNLRFRFTFVRTTTGGNLRVDDFTVRGNSSPTITGAATTSAFTTTYGTASTAQNFTVSGSNLSANLVATAPAGFEVSADGTTYGSTATFTQTSGSASGTLRVRLSSTATPGTYNSKAIVLSSTGATSISITTPATGNSVATKALTIASPAVSTKVYDGTTSATITGTLTGIVNSDAITLNGTGTFASSAVGTWAVTSTATLGGANASYYTLTQPTGLTGVIQPASSPTISGGTSTLAFTTTYGTSSASQSFAISGTNLTDNIIATAPTGFEVSNDGTSYATSVTYVHTAGTASGTLYIRLSATATAGAYNAQNIVLSSTGAPSVSITTPASGNTIAPLALTVSGLTGVSKVYDKTTAATFTGTPSLSGFVYSESFTITGTPVATFSTATVGTAKTITINGYTVASANYTISAPTVTADITAATLTLNGAAVTSKIFDGTTAATITGTLNGVISSDVVTFNGTGTYASSAIGTGISVTSTSTLSGADAGNYTLVQPTGLTGTILSGPSTLAAGDIAIISANASSTDTFSILLLKDIGANTVINFTDNGFTGNDTTGRVGEGFLTFTAPTALPYGTILTWTNGMTITGTGWSSNNPTSFALNASGEQLFVFQGATSNWASQSGIKLIFGMNFGAALSGTSSASNTLQPNASILPATAFLNLPAAGNGYFSMTGSASAAVTICGNAATILSYIVTTNKWYTSSSATTFPTYTISTTCPPAIAATGSLTAFTTTYGTASSTQTVTVSGTNLTADLVATAPTGFEVSTNGTTWASTATFTQTSGSASGTLYVHLAAAATVSGAYNSKNIVLSSTGATSVNVATTATGNTVAALALTIIGVSGVSKEYDGTTTATLSGTAAYNGLVNGDSFSSVSGTAVAHFADKNVGTAKTITVSGFTAPSSNYTVVQPTVSADITAKDLTVTNIVANDKVYDGDYTATVTATLNGAITPDNVTLSNTASFIDGPYIGNFGVTVAFTLNGTDVANYNLVQPDTSGLNATITPKPLTISNPIASNKVYDGTTLATISGTIVGVVATSGEVVTLNGSYGTFASSAIGSNIVVTPTWMIDGDTYNYTLVAPTVTLTANITSPGSPVITSDTTATAAYGDATTSYTIATDIAASSYSASGLPDGLSINTTTGQITGTPSAAGTFNVTLGADGIGGTGYATLVYTITPITLNVINVSANDKTYDGTTNATINGTLDGVINGDEVVFNGNGSFDVATVGNAINVTSTATLSGSKASNYTLIQPTGLAATITAKTLTVTATVADKVYDRTNSASISMISLNGIVGADDVTATIAGNFDSVTVGTNKSVSVTSLILNGANATNYSVTTPSLTGNITPKSLTVAATAANKVYDGTTTATINVSAITGVIAPDTVTVTGGGAFASSAVGTNISVTPSLVLGGANASNYTLTQPSGLSANITTPPTTLAAGDIAVIGYNTSGSPDNFAILVLKDLTAGTQFFVNDNEVASAGGSTFTDLAEGEASFTVKAGQTIAAGTVIVLPWGAAAVSTTTYDWSTTSGFGLGGSNDELYIYTASSITATTPSLFIYFAKLGTSTSAVPSGLTLGYTSIAPTAAASRYSTTGNIYNSCKSILLTEIGKTTTSNWNTTGASALAASDWSFTVLATCPTPAISTSGSLAALTTVYGSASATTSFTVSGTYLTTTITVTAPTGFEISTSATSGFASTLTLSPSSGNVNSIIIYVRLASSATVVNSPYSGDIVCSSTGATAVNVSTASSTVTPKEVTVTGVLVNNKVQSIGDFTATLSGTAVLNGVLSIDTSNVTLGGTPVATFAQDTAGTNIAVTVTGYSLSGTAAANYSLTQPSLIGTISSVASPVITSALTFTSVYGTEATSYTITATSDELYPVLSYNATGLPSGLSIDTATGIISGTPTATPGNYTITIAATNVGGTSNALLAYTISAKPLTVTGATASSKVYNGSTAATITGFTLNDVYGTDVVTAIGSGVFDTKNVGTAKNVTATMTLNGADAAKYTLVQPTGLTADITPLALILSGATAQNKVYDGTTNATITATLVGVVSGDAVVFNGTGTFASSGIAQGIAVTSTATLTGTDAGNYSFTQPTGLTANITDKIIYLNVFTGASACPTNGNVPTMASNATGAALTRHTITCNSTANVFNSTTISTTSSLSPTSYIEFSVSAATGYQLNLSSISFFRQASNSAPNQLEVRYSTDGFATYSTWGAAPNSPTSGTVATWDFADFSSPMSGTVTFRIYPYGTQRADNTGASSTSGTFRLDDVTVYGSVDLVNPPSSATISGDATICVGSTTNLNVTVADGKAPYTVVYTDGTSNYTVTNYASGAAISVAPTATTSYSLVSVTDANNLQATTVYGSASVVVNPLTTYYVDADGDGFGSTTSADLCAATAPTGYATNNTDCNDAAYSLTNACSSVLNLKVVLQGYYDVFAHSMVPAMANEGVGSSETDVDTITVELHDASGTLVSSTTGMLQTNGLVSLSFEPVSGDYYVVVSHRNTIVSSSASLVSFVSGVATSYDFTTSASQAYADNQVMVDTGVYALYTGDLNQDGYIDASDFPAFDSDNQLGTSGVYISTDMNGDGYVDASDFPIFDSNNQNGITSILPY